MKTLGNPLPTPSKCLLTSHYSAPILACVNIIIISEITALEDPNSHDSQRHLGIWRQTLLAFVPGPLFLGIGLRGHPQLLPSEGKCLLSSPLQDPHNTDNNQLHRAPDIPCGASLSPAQGRGEPSETKILAGSSSGMKRTLNHHHQQGVSVLVDCRPWDIPEVQSGEEPRGQDLQHVGHLAGESLVMGRLRGCGVGLRPGISTGVQPTSREVHSVSLAFSLISPNTANFDMQPPK